MNIDIPFQNHVFPWLLAYDIESYFKKPAATYSKIKVLSNHEILSISISSNIDDKDLCLVSQGDSYKLVQNTIIHLERLIDIAFSKSFEYYKEIIKAIDDAIANNQESNA